MIDKDTLIAGVAETYPDELLENRLTIEANLISCYMKDMLLLDTTPMDKDCWVIKDCKFYYLLLTSLRSKGFSSLDEVTILSNFPDKVIDIYNEFGGWETIEHQIRIININNFDAYCEALDHSNMQLKLYKDGIDILKKITLPNGKEIRPFDMFKDMTSEEINDWYCARINGYNRSVSNKILFKGKLSSGKDLVKKLKKGEIKGVPFSDCLTDINGNVIKKFPFISNQIMGYSEKTFSMLGAYSGDGKTTLWINIIMCLMAHGKKVLVISNEVDEDKYNVSLLTFKLYTYCKYFNLTKKKLLEGSMITPEDEAQIELADKWWDDNFADKFTFIHITDMDDNLIKKEIREHVLRYGYDTVLIDTFKLDLDAVSNSNQRTDLHLVKTSRMLDSLAKKLNIIILGSLQLALRTQGTLFLTASVLSESKQIKEVLESLMLMRKVFPEELDPENKKYYCHPFRLKNVNGEWIEEEYEIDKNAIYRMLFIDKTRSGATSSDTGVAYLLKYRGDYCVFSESAQCRPKHGMIV